MAVTRVVASAVILAILIPRVHLSSLLPPGHPHTFLWVAAALGVTFLGIVLSAVRWQRVLAALGPPRGRALAARAARPRLARGPADAGQALPGQPVRGQRAHLHRRRRRSAREP